MRADEAALLRSMVAIVRQRYGLDEIEAAAYVVDMPSRIKALEAENAALRARAVPALEWDNDEAQAGLFECSISPLTDGDFDWFIVWPGEEAGTINLEEGTEPTREEAEDACEAAFLRLVGCKNG